MATVKKEAVKKGKKVVEALTGDAANRARVRKIIASRKARQKKADAKIARERARVDPGVPAGAHKKLDPIGTPKKDIKEEIAGAGALREGQVKAYKDPVAGKKAKGGTKKARDLIKKTAEQAKKKLQRDWDDLTSSQQRAQIAKGKDSKYWTIFPKEGGGAKIKKSRSSGGPGSKKGKALDAALKTFKHGGLAKAGHKDYRKGGIFY
jgi:hypothetical protein